MRVAIVGAGLAGLRAAMLLEGLGARVHVFEASSRLGGRLRTARPMAGVTYEAGGEWIDAEHLHLRALLEHLGTPPVPVSKPDALVCIGGERVRQSALWPEAQMDEEVFYQEAGALCRRLEQAGWRGAEAEEADARSLASFVDAVAISPQGRTWLDLQLRSDEGTDLEQVGLLGWLLGWSNYVDRTGDEKSSFAFSVPSDVLVERILVRLKGPIHLDTPVIGIACNGDGTTVYTAGKRWSFDRVVVTLPPNLLQYLPLPNLPMRKHQAIAAYGVSSVLKIALLYEYPWWRESMGCGRLWSDGLVQQTWAPIRAEGNVLIAYVCGHRSRRLLEMGSPVKRVMHELAGHFEGARDGLLGAWVHNWQQERYAGLAHVHLGTGCGTDGAHFDTAVMPAGPVHFAGSWTSRWHGFLEGALESAERVVCEINLATATHAEASL